MRCRERTNQPLSGRQRNKINRILIKIVGFWSYPLRIVASDNASLAIIFSNRFYRFIRSHVQAFDLLSGILAALVYGGWAVFVNWGDGVRIAAVTGSVQASYAFTSTLFLTYIVRQVYLKLGRALWGMVTGFMVGLTIIVSLPWALQSLVGNPNTLATILPGIIWGSIYVVGFLCYLEFYQGERAKLLRVRE